MERQNEKAARLVHYINGLADFELTTTVAARYDHMGAIIAEAGLQAGINYTTVVRPRIEALLANYPNTKTSSDFQRLLQSVGAGELLSWKGGRKISAIIDLTRLFVDERVETVADLRRWLLQEGSSQRLIQIKGIGPKTADLLKIMVGISASAIDRHIYNFLALAGVRASSYQEAQTTFNAAADLLGVSHSALDDSVWNYMMAKGSQID